GAEQPDAVYACLPLPNLLALLLRHLGNGCAVVCGVRASDMTRARVNRLVRMTLQLERQLVLHADMVVVNSQTGARHLCRGKQYEHVVVIENGDRKSTRLNSSHVKISYAVFCLK